MDEGTAQSQTFTSEQCPPSGTLTRSGTTDEALWGPQPTIPSHLRPPPSLPGTLPSSSHCLGCTTSLPLTTSRPISPLDHSLLLLRLPQTLHPFLSPPCLKLSPSLAIKSTSLG